MKKRKLQFKKKSTKPISIFVLIGSVVLGIILLQPLLKTLRSPEPLADSTSLALLEKGLPLPVPPDEIVGEYLGVKVATLNPYLYPVKSQSVLGVSAAEKRIEVDLTNQKVYAFEGNNKIFEFLVSTGKWSPTPKGSYTIWSKVRSQKMSGGSKENGTYYYLPNVPFVMFFYNREIPKHQGYSLHGTYWHSNFGHPMSHGCVNMRTEEVQKLYEWATPQVTNEKAWSTLATPDNPGTKVIIYGVTPKS